MNSESIQIGAALRAALRRRGLSQEQVAAEFQVSQPRISRVLQGEFTRRSQLAQQMCATYLNGGAASELAEYAHTEAAGQAFEKVVRVLRLMWDGSVEHADRLATMVDAIRRSPPADTDALL